MFAQPPLAFPITPTTGMPLNPRCWSCRDTGWIVSTTCQGMVTLWTSCACRIFTVDPVPQP